MKVYIAALMENAEFIRRSGDKSHINANQEISFTNNLDRSSMARY